jgi:hypothetical protein
MNMKPQSQPETKGTDLFMKQSLKKERGGLE